MPEPTLPSLLCWLSLVAIPLLGCGTTAPAMGAWEEATPEAANTCEAPDTDQCIVLACEGEEGLCGVFACEDVDPDAVASTSLAHEASLVLARGGGHRPPMRGPVSWRHWRRSGLREGARPRMTFHFQYRFGYLPAFPRYEGRVVRHHLFPQALEFKDWFGRSGIAVHQYTMLIPEHIHRQIHGGTGRGGLWNEAWRQFYRANPRPQPPEVLFRYALELAFRYELTGPIVPYNRPVIPIGPQLYGN
ncbi:SitA6 family polymorphic toxin lipoprotein [Hyalangium gracile]|uniref:SitA6 family polymorphic toxin lipoprotein n=1 Tax=Hyalangium gracile TaxID=394092 RepID=UPI001CCBAC52|nr:TIGR02269 family lipoprotein [Hyalangium gracile]